MHKRHLPRAWEYTRFWQKEREAGGCRVEPIKDDDLPPIDDLPEHLRMPRTRGEVNRFRLALKKSDVQARRGESVSTTYMFARLRRKMREWEEEKAEAYVAEQVDEE